MVVDCGGGTVDLTTHKLIGNNLLQLSEVTERIGYFCGSSFIDNEFIKFLRKIFGDRAIDLLIENNYDQFQCLIQEFRKNVKEPFTGYDIELNYELVIGNVAPNLLQYVSEEIRKRMEESKWSIDIKYNDVKSMFDPIIDRILRMIYVQFDNTQKACSAMFLVGGFCENKYLQKRIQLEFNNRVKTMSVPTQPIAAISRGAVIYGLSIKSGDHAISSKVLKYTYGFKSLSIWKEGIDPLERKISGGRICKFSPLVKRGTEVKVDQVFSSNGHEIFLFSVKLIFQIYKTPKYNAEYCDEPEVEFVGKLQINLSDVQPGCRNGSVTFGISFGQMEILAFAKNEINGQTYATTFFVDEDFYD
jgi:hypothetical protein